MTREGGNPNGTSMIFVLFGLLIDFGHATSILNGVSSFHLWSPLWKMECTVQYMPGRGILFGGKHAPCVLLERCISPEEPFTEMEKETLPKGENGGPKGLERTTTKTKRR